MNVEKVPLVVMKVVVVVVVVAVVGIQLDCQHGCCIPVGVSTLQIGSCSIGFVACTASEAYQ